MPKFRGIGKTLKEYSESWLPTYESQIVNPREYKVEVLRHNYDMQYSSIFLINDFGIWGDLIEGVHWQLTQGVSERSPLTFYYNFQNLWFHDEESRQIENYKNLITTAIKHLLVVRPQLQYSLESELQAEFTMHGYLKGYFEFFYWPERGLTYNDYNRVIYRKLNNLKLYITDAQADLKGLCANPGKVVGQTRIVNNPKAETLNIGEILVCKSINMDYLPFMTKCAGIVTEQGNILSHLAIISRELKKPCIVSVKNITRRLKNGDRIRLDADKGIIEMMGTETNI
jgi:phosphohistidine swiveling domain-containing protein